MFYSLVFHGSVPLELNLCIIGNAFTTAENGQSEALKRHTVEKSYIKTGLFTVLYKGYAVTHKLPCQDTEATTAVLAWYWIMAFPQPKHSKQDTLSSQ